MIYHQQYFVIFHDAPSITIIYHDIMIFHDISSYFTMSSECLCVDSSYPLDLFGVSGGFSMLFLIKI